MALVTKYSLVEQIRSLLAGGSPSAGAKFEPRMIAAHLQQAINKRLKVEYLSVTLPGEETIPEGLVLACYDNVAVDKYKGLSRAKLPAIPISLRRNMGVWFVGPSIPNLNLDTSVLVVTDFSDTQIDLTWGLINHATSYLIKRATDASFVDNLTDVYLGSALLFSDTGLTPATTYYYRITALATGYTDSNYGIASATTLGNLLEDENGSLTLAETGDFILTE